MSSVNVYQLGTSWVYSRLVEVNAMWLYPIKLSILHFNFIKMLSSANDSLTSVIRKLLLPLVNVRQRPLSNGRHLINLFSSFTIWLVVWPIPGLPWRGLTNTASYTGLDRFFILYWWDLFDSSLLFVHRISLVHWVVGLLVGMF